jgi:2-haloalkanoic acid dehalogenase type II
LAESLPDFALESKADLPIEAAAAPELDGIFLDMYGTITSGDRQAVESVCGRIIAEHQVSITAHELSITWGGRFFAALDDCSGDRFITLAELERKTLVETMSGLGVAVDPEPYVQDLMAYWRNPPLHEDARAFFEQIRYPVCLVSNADHQDAVLALESHGIKLQFIITSEHARSYKPDREIFEKALQMTGWRRDRVMHVGDSLHSDVGGARVAGIRAGWVNRAHRIHDIGTHEPDHEFEDLMGLMRFLHAGA